jgi:hypothetical protein
MIGVLSLVVGAHCLEGPVPTSFQNGHAGSPRRLCPTTEVSLSANANLIADVEDFYGNIRTSAFLGGSVALGDDAELFLDVELVRYQTVISSLSAATLGFGHTSLGGTYVVLRSDVTLGITARATLPTATGYYRGARPLALDAGLMITNPLARGLDVHAEVGVLASVGVGDGPADPRAGLFLIWGASYRPWDWLALVLTADAQFLHDARLDHVALGGGVRFLIGSVGIDLFFEGPLFGRERTTVAGIVALRYDFGS